MAISFAIKSMTTLGIHIMNDKLTKDEGQPYFSLAFF